MTGRAQALPPVRVVPMTIDRPRGAEPVEWFACCTETVWLHADGRQSDGCNWYGEYRDTIRAARSDAAGHRRAHRSLYAPEAER